MVSAGPPADAAAQWQAARCKQDEVQLDGDTIKKKFKGSLIGGVVFYSVSNLLMYSVPIPFLHPIMGSIAGLIFNVWLAIVAYKKS